MMTFLAQHRKWTLAVVACLILVLWLLIPPKQDMEKLQSLMDRGHYSAVVNGAQQVLAKSPETEEYRELLAKVQPAMDD